LQTRRTFVLVPRPPPPPHSCAEALAAVSEELVGCAFAAFRAGKLAFSVTFKGRRFGALDVIGAGQNI
jgi:hypothetical protein